jgi:hypothetical protein
MSPSHLLSSPAFRNLLPGVGVAGPVCVANVFCSGLSIECSPNLALLLFTIQ